MTEPIYVVATLTIKPSPMEALRGPAMPASKARASTPLLGARKVEIIHPEQVETR
ncbi:hypothetical protein ACSBOB_31235 [Mesorhizobium sp. ASY16-5R]|uniref:hypothetical protein n=1 Tax=Mesorhizobium sp. ASY16-5R TaxID=3445772 RepID=UPI003F9F41C5